MVGNRKLIFYGAVSLDGYLARENDSLDWLLGTEGEDETGYSTFYDSVDTILMGRRTYDQITSTLAPDKFPYEGKECYVFSRNLIGTNRVVEFVSDNIVDFTRTLKDKAGRNIWIVGGGEVLKRLMDAALVDEFIIQIAPTIIGKGIRLFLSGQKDHRLTLVDVKRYKQFAELHYEIR